MTAGDAYIYAFGASSMIGYDLNAFTADTQADMTATQKALFLNEALRRIALRTKMYDPSVVFTLTANVDTYLLRGSAFGKKIVKPRSVIINGIPLWDAKREFFGMWSMDELNAVNSQWRAQTANNPLRAVYLPRSLILNPKPTQAIVDAGNNYVEAEVLPAELTVAFGGISGITSATPGVVQTSAAHGLTDGSPVYIRGCAGVADGGNYFAKATTYDTTHFGLYSDAALTSPVTSSSASVTNGYWDGLIAPAAVLDIEDELHYVACELAAVLAATGTGDEANAWQRLSAYNSDAMGMIDSVATRNDNALSGWRTMESDDSGMMWL